MTSRYPFNTASILIRVYKVNGFTDLTSSISSNPDQDMADILNAAHNDVLEDYEDWDGDEFGSSDFTFVLKSFIEYVIMYSGIGDKFKIEFNPCLSIVKL